ncbi:phospholipase D-like domain-containing protein [Nitrogeniibacter aestuarii]|uniref:phospholipase D-like domain-containing protein n=1 Tax=Nitrogeniibacter aestuarii TaxID=2815343 RepID=UPI001D12EE29|nr:phospholipase D-like domain-containing protein [Nitrogeniibacter aestuarii]
MKPDAGLEDILAHLRVSAEDLRLSTDERRRFDALLGQARPNEEGLRRLRNAAFELVRDRIKGAEDPVALVGWLERVAKAIDVARMPTTRAVETRAWFSPGDACRNGVIHQLKAAREQVCICVFTISDDRIAEAILAAHLRGVDVRILTDNDKRFDAGSDVDQLRRSGLRIAEDRSPAHMHHKFALYDRAVLHTGSFNWTRSASSDNEENLLQTGDPVAVRAFTDRFESLWRRYAEPE